MASVALTLRVLADTSQAASEMRQLSNETESFGQRAAKVAAVAAGFAAVTGAIMKAAQSASALEQASGGVEAVFKSGADQVKKWAAEAASSIGLSKSQYMELATLIGSQLKNAGVSMDELGSSTNQLIQQGADLAAMFGGTTAEAVESISAALKGERDPIEKYGITLTEASVQAEILALGLDTSTSAAQQNAKAMATLSLITKQGSDAWGAAAREADTFASQQQILQAVFENVMADVGSIFLPMLADLAGAFTDMMPAIQAMLTPLAGLVALIAGMPTPILGAVAAFAAWKTLGIGSYVSTMFTSMSTAWAGFAREMQSAKIGSFLSQSGQQMTTFGAASQAARKQFGGFLTTLGKSVGGFAAFAVAAVAVSQFVDSLDDGQAVIDSFNDSVANLSETMIEAGSADWTASMQESWESTARLSDSFAALRDQGIDAATAMAYLTDTGFQPTAQQSEALSNAVGNMGMELGITTARFREQAAAAQETAQAALDKKAADQAEAAAAAAAGQATAAQTQILQEQAQAQAKAAVEASKVAAEQTGVAQAMRDSDAATASAARALSAFTLALDQLSGRNITAEQAALALNNGMRSLQESFQGAAEAGGYSTDALVNWDVAALTSTKAGADLYGSLNDVRGGYDASISAAYSQAAANGDAAAGMAAARAAADSAYSSFISLATQAGLTGEQAAQLAAKLGIVAGTDIPDKTFELIAQDQQAQAAVTEAQNAEISAKTFDVDAIIAPALGQFSMLTGQKLDNTVAVDANTGQATNQINALTSAQRSTTVQTQADTNQAQSTLQGFTSAQRSTSITVQANTTAAQDAITSLVNQRRVLTIIVEANTAPAQNAINSIQGKTVNVQVNTTQTVTQVTVPAAASAASLLAAGAPLSMLARSADAPGLSPMALAAAAAPPPMRNLAAANAPDTEGGGGTTVQITVNGALDPDAVARQIDQLMTRYARRTGGVQLGTTVRRVSV